MVVLMFSFISFFLLYKRDNVTLFPIIACKVCIKGKLLLKTNFPLVKEYKFEHFLNL